MSGEGFLDDYANVAHGLLELHLATGDLRWLQEARRLALLAVDLFHDPDNGGFFLAPTGGEELVARTKGLDDNPIPYGDSMLAHVLLRLGRIWGDDELERLGVSVLRLVAPMLDRAPGAFGWALCALDLWLRPRPTTASRAAAEVQVERAERPAERAGCALEHGATSRSTATARRSSSSSPQIRAEPQQHVREHRVAGRDRVVVEVLRARDELLAVGGREEEAAALVVGEQLDREQREPARLEQPAQRRRSRRAARAARARRSRSRRGSRRRSPSRPPGAEQAAVGRRAGRAGTPPHADGGVEPVRPLQPPARLGERREREPVPRGDRLVVEPRLRPCSRSASSRARSSDRARRG